MKVIINIKIKFVCFRNDKNNFDFVIVGFRQKY